MDLFAISTVKGKFNMNEKITFKNETKTVSFTKDEVSIKLSYDYVYLKEFQLVNVCIKMNIKSLIEEVLKEADDQSDELVEGILQYFFDDMVYKQGSNDTMVVNRGSRSGLRCIKWNLEFDHIVTNYGKSRFWTTEECRKSRANKIN